MHPAGMGMTWSHQGPGLSQRAGQLPPDPGRALPHRHGLRQALLAHTHTHTHTHTTRHNWAEPGTRVHLPGQQQPSLGWLRSQVPAPGDRPALRDGDRDGNGRSGQASPSSHPRSGIQGTESLQVPHIHLPHPHLRRAPRQHPSPGHTPRHRRPAGGSAARQRSRCGPTAWRGRWRRGPSR